MVTAMGSIALGVEISYGSLIFGNILAAIVGMILELFLFSVDYARSERLQFEDDEYYYYVTAVPKIKVAAVDKTVTRIVPDEDDENQDLRSELIKVSTQVLSTKEIPVYVETEGAPASGYRLVQTDYKPESIQVSGTKEALEKEVSINYVVRYDYFHDWWFAVVRYSEPDCKPWWYKWRGFDCCYGYQYENQLITG